jgi:hypothetical protein
MLLRKSLLLQMQFVLSLLQPATLEPDVNCSTQGFCEGAQVRMYLSVWWRKGTYGTVGNTACGGADADECREGNDGGGAHFER